MCEHIFALSLDSLFVSLSLHITANFLLSHQPQSESPSTRTMYNSNFIKSGIISITVLLFAGLSILKQEQRGPCEGQSVYFLFFSSFTEGDCSRIQSIAKISIWHFWQIIRLHSAYTNGIMIAMRNQEQGVLGQISTQPDALWVIWGVNKSIFQPNLTHMVAVRRKKIETVTL